MTASAVRQITQPNYFRDRHNTGAATIPRGYILTPSTTVVDGCALATSSSQNFCGVSTEPMEGSTYGKAITRSVQIDGKAPIIPGAQIAIGDELTCDSTGRAIPATSRNQSVIGRAETAAAGASTDFADAIEVELTIGQVSAAGGVQCAQLTVDYTNLTAAALLQEFALASLPAGAVIHQYQVVPSTLFVKAATTFALSIGYTGALTYVASALNVGTGGTVTTPQEAAVSKALVADKVIKVGITVSAVNLGDGTTTACTAGSCIIRLFYSLPVALVVAPAAP